MIKITLAVVGKIKEKYFVDAIAEYSKRLGGYCKLEIKEVSDEMTKEKASDVECEKIRLIEGERLLSVIPDGAYVCAMCIDGKMLSSEELSGKMSDIMVRSYDHIVFVIGGSIGLGSNILSRADFKLSFGKVTYPHQLMRVIMLEQIYRSFRIMNHEPYHK